MDNSMTDEAALGEVIDERDAAEEALSQAFYLVTGRSPEWSNLFGHEQALEEIGDACSLLRKAATPPVSRDAGVLVEALEKIKSNLGPVTGAGVPGPLWAAGAAWGLRVQSDFAAAALAYSRRSDGGEEAPAADHEPGLGWKLSPGARDEIERLVSENVHNAGALHGIILATLPIAPPPAPEVGEEAAIPKAAMSIAHMVDREAASTISRLLGERDNAVKARTTAIGLMTEAAREAGEWKGRFEASELCGIVEGWQTRALTAEARVGRLEGALTKAAAWYRDYERQHYAKCTTDGQQKAVVNGDRAAFLEAALSKDTTQP